MVLARAVQGRLETRQLRLIFAFSLSQINPTARDV
jgi:hypothetical protein